MTFFCNCYDLLIPTLSSFAFSIDHHHPYIRETSLRISLHILFQPFEIKSQSRRSTNISWESSLLLCLWRNTWRGRRSWTSFPHSFGHSSGFLFVITYFIIVGVFYIAVVIFQRESHAEHLFAFIQTFGPFFVVASCYGLLPLNQNHLLSLH